jgi:hypothetical protein
MGEFMRRLRVLHLYIGSFFAPLLLYFALSGSWQLFHLHKHPRDQAPTAVQKILGGLSNPHVDGAMFFGDAHDDYSTLFRVFSELMAFGFILTTLLGIQMAFQYKHRRKSVTVSLILGALLPLLALFVKHG